MNKQTQRGRQADMRTNKHREEDKETCEQTNRKRKTRRHVNKQTQRGRQVDM